MAKAWISNFQSEKDVHEATLAFIETCVPQLEPLDFTIRGKSMSISWEAKDIMRGWFSGHKKYTICEQRIS